MKSFEYTIKDPQGLHARPAGQLTKEAAKYTSLLQIKKGEKAADMKKIFAIMGLCVKNGDAITISADGPDEDQAIADLQVFFETNV